MTGTTPTWTTRGPRGGGDREAIDIPGFGTICHDDDNGATGGAARFIETHDRHRSREPVEPEELLTQVTDLCDEAAAVRETYPVAMFWHGGSSYSTGDPTHPESYAAFGSLGSCRREFSRRVDDSYYPMVHGIPAEEGGPSAWIYLDTTPEEVASRRDHYPDAVMEFDAEGEVQVSSA